MNYYEALKYVIDAASPVTGLTKRQLEDGIEQINKTLIGPMRDVDRIKLCGHRASLRKTLNLLS